MPLHPTTPDDLAVALDAAVEAEDALLLTNADLREAGIRAFTALSDEDVDALQSDNPVWPTFSSPDMAALKGTLRAVLDRPRNSR